MNSKQAKLLEALKSKKLLKVIAGINNFDEANVLAIAGAANHINRSVDTIAVDICAKEEIINSVLNLCPELPVFVSSVDMNELRRAQELGADVLELGNFEALHEEGIYPSAAEVLAWAEEIMAFRTSAVVSITMPGHLEVAEQVSLAARLQEMGVELIQTEGASLVKTEQAGALGQVEKVSITLANTIELAKVLDTTFLMTASGISPDTAPLAIAAGASGLGVGKYVNKLSSELEMLAAVKALTEAIETPAKVTQLV